MAVGQQPDHLRRVGHPVNFFNGTKLNKGFVRARGRNVQRADALSNLIYRFGKLGDKLEALGNV